MSRKRCGASEREEFRVWQSPKFRIDTDVNELLVHSIPQRPKLVSIGATLPEPVFPQHPDSRPGCAFKQPQRLSPGFGNRVLESCRERIGNSVDVAALAAHIMTNTALTGATYDIDGGQQLVAA